MLDPTDLDREFFHDALVELVRADILTDAMLTRMERRFESEAREHYGSDRAERYERLAHMARMLPVEAAAEAPSEFRASQRRRHLRAVPSDGGKAHS